METQIAELETPVEKPDTPPARMATQPPKLDTPSDATRIRTRVPRLVIKSGKAIARSVDDSNDPTGHYLPQLEYKLGHPAE